ncbi:TPA: IS3 family transposase, partial [Salmonella enterica]|nr:IS3 family transposase [Salmonella enterica]
HTLRVECIHGEDFVSREIMRTAVFNYSECDYNRWRRHSACGGLSPETRTTLRVVPTLRG